MVCRSRIPMAIAACLVVVSGVAAAQASGVMMRDIQTPDAARQAMEEAARREQAARHRAEQLAREASLLGDATERSTQ